MQVGAHANITKPHGIVGSHLHAKKFDPITGKKNKEYPHAIDEPMSTEDRMIAGLPDQQYSDGVRWLVLEFDDATGGWFLFGHRRLSEPSEFDSWHETRLKALQEAEGEWGVAERDWRVSVSGMDTDDP